MLNVWYQGQTKSIGTPSIRKDVKHVKETLSQLKITLSKIVIGNPKKTDEYNSSDIDEDNY